MMEHRCASPARGEDAARIGEPKIEDRDGTMADATRFYITTAIDYPNSRPHIGTAFEKIGADVQARFRRMEGASVHFLMGNDENTNKVTLRAQELGLEPKPYVDDMARQFQEVCARSRSRTTISSRPAKSGTTSAAASSSRPYTTPATSTRASTRGITVPAASRSRPRRKRPRRAASAPTTRTRRWPGSRRRTTISGSRRTANACSIIMLHIPSSFSPKAAATRSSTWSRPS